MRIYVKVTPRAGKNEVTKISDREYSESNGCARKGKVNEAIVKLLAEHFRMPKSSISIIGGKSTRAKIIDMQA